MAFKEYIGTNGRSETCCGVSELGDIHSDHYISSLTKASYESWKKNTRAMRGLSVCYLREDQSKFKTFLKKNGWTEFDRFFNPQTHHIITVMLKVLHEDPNKAKVKKRKRSILERS